MEIIYLFILFLFLIALELIYFKLAANFNIIDNPNNRSSHKITTIRGGGIIFPIAVILYTTMFDPKYLFFFIGLLGISLISFVDDIKSVSNKIRICVHIFAAVLLCFQINVNGFGFLIIPILVLIIGIINAVNFMDGINGITGGYSIVTLSTLLYINLYIVQFSNSNLIVIVLSSVLVFSYFNFRYQARCFAGDIGSVSIAFILIFFVMQLVTTSGNISYILFFLLYGLDTATTIFFRLIRRENIFEAHRGHYYQFLANERSYSQIYVALSYSILQLFLNIIIVALGSSYINQGILIIISLILFLIVRFSTEGKKRLLNRE